MNRFLAHLAARAFSPATIRAYAFDLLNFLRFCAGRRLVLAAVSPAEMFAYLEWQARPGRVNQRPDRRYRQL